MTTEEFRIDIRQVALDDLGERLERTRWPSQIPGIGWDRGVPVDYLRRLTEYWAHSYDWRAWEAKLNRFAQFTTRIDGQHIHFVHVRSPEPDAMPLVITHGWPGSIVEFIDILGPLTDPVAHGGDRADAFHVVAPSVPGFGFSIPLAEAGWNHRRIALAWAELMSRLGYGRFGAHGGDTGSVVSPELGRVAPEHVVAVHICGALRYPSADPADFEDLTEVERVGSAKPSGSGRSALDTPTSDRPDHRRWRTRSTTRPSVNSPGSSRSSGSGPIPPRRSPTTPST